MLKKESLQTKGCYKLMKATLLLLTVDHCLHSFQFPDEIKYVYF